ncbi:unnamed protein product [Lactuca virosa]|uniref:Phytocyanin domain-containing protein n=1 Tax=Lactuca virosa TaxID=75947 RepID=A0AAU9MPS4_9ASTR|nr:unnamed protein product [Lactuca virosa]
MTSASTNLALLFLTCIIAAVAGRQFLVGENVGWRVPAMRETQLYDVWAFRRHFYVGDTLRFQYKNDSVVLTTESAFLRCDSRQPISVFNDGNTVINLDKVGKFYFISGKANRCIKGQKMAVNVESRNYPYPPPVVTPPHSPNYPIYPAPASSQLPGSGNSSDSGPEATVSISVMSFIVAIVGLWLCVDHP